MARTDTLGNFLTDVAEAIRTKKGTTDTIPASSFDTEIANLPSGGGKYAPRKISYYGFNGAELNYELSNLNISNITNMAYMFYGCKNITELDLSSFNTSNVTDMSYMFYNCEKLTGLDLSNFDTSNVTNMSYMFYGCENITGLDLSNFDTSNVTNMTRMFSGCSKLTVLDIRSFDFTKVTSFSAIFGSVPTDCEIIVKDETAKTWITEKFTFLTNVKTVAELETETSA